MPTRHSSVGALSRREAWVAPAYFAIYLASLFASLESEMIHWITLVAVPLVLAAGFAPRERRQLGAVLATLGLQRGSLRRGLGWALLLGGVIAVLQTLFMSHGPLIRDLILTGRAVWMFPLTFLLMLFTAGFTEEFFFRGFLQTRVERLTGSRWLAIGIVAVLFGLYHLPYAYLNPMWRSAGDWGAAWGAAMGNGVLGGVVLGVLYSASRNNLVPCIVLHSLINAAPAMTLIRFGGG